MRMDLDVGYAQVQSVRKGKLTLCVLFMLETYHDLCSALKSATDMSGARVSRTEDFCQPKQPLPVIWK
jgi:hypothetical protein